MKKEALIALAIMIALTFASCGRNSKNLIGDFTVISKMKSSPQSGVGLITLRSKIGDTVIVPSRSEVQYLTIKVGDILPVRSNGKKLFLSLKKDPEIVGLSTVLKKYNYNGKNRCDVQTRGGDTITTQVSDQIFYRTEVGHELLVRVNRKKRDNKDAAKYYVK